MKTIVDVALVKVTEVPQEGGVSIKRTMVDSAELKQSRYFTDRENGRLEKTVLHDNHALVVKLGGPDAVEVLFSRPFCDAS